MKPEELIEEHDLPESFHEIDEDDLAGEWNRQPQLYLQTAMKLAAARKAVLDAKAEMEECGASLAKAIRTDPEKFRVTKITEATIEEVIKTHQKYKTLQAAYNEAKYLEDLLDVATKTLEHKKKALENLVYLIGQGIHSAPKAKSAGSRSELRSQEMRQQVKKNQKNLSRPTSE